MFEIMEESLLVCCQNSRIAKVNKCRFHHLKTDCCCHNSFLFFCRLSVLSQRILPVFRAMLPIASTPWKASLIGFSYHKINKAITMCGHNRKLATTKSASTKWYKVRWVKTMTATEKCKYNSKMAFFSIHETKGFEIQRASDCRVLKI